MQNIFTGDEYNELPLTFSLKQNSRTHEELCQIIHCLFQYMITHHSKVYVTRITLKFPTATYHCYPHDNSTITTFMEALIRYCTRKNYDPKYLWVREVSPRSGQHHFHCLVLFNGNRVETTNWLKMKVHSLWGRVLGIDAGGYFNIDKPFWKVNEKRGIMIRRYLPECPLHYEAALQWAYYLAKVYSKERQHKFLRGYGCSVL